LKFKSPAEFIKNYLNFWEKYKIYLRWHRKIFCYLDRYFLKNEHNSLYKEGFKILKENVIDYYNDLLFKNIVTELNRERNQE